MNKLLTKKNVLFFGFITTLLFFVSIFSQEFRFCEESQYSCMDNFDNIAEALQVFLGVYIFSALTYKMRDEIFAAWIKFAQWWAPLSVFAVLIAPKYNHDWMFPIDKSRVSFGMSILFLIISLVLITWKWFALRKTK